MEKGLKKKLSYFEKELGKLRKAIGNDRDVLLVDTMFYTGCTVSELVKLKKENLDFRNKKIRLHENRSKKTIIKHIPTELKGLLENFSKAITDDSDYIFSNNGKPLSTRRVGQIIAYYSNFCGIHFTPKKIRNLYLLKKSISGRISETGLKNIQPFSHESIPPLQKITPANERDFLIYSLVKETGCKTGQLRNILVKDIGRKNNAISINKASFKLPPCLYKRLREFSKSKKPHDFLFSNKKKSPLSSRRIQQIFLRVAGASPTKTRRRYVYKEYSGGKSPLEIKEKLGIKRLDAFNYGVIRI